MTGCTVSRAGFRVGIALVLLMLPVAQVLAQQTWNVAVKLDQATSLSDDDASGEDDIYLRTRMLATVGTGSPVECSFKQDHVDDDNDITPGWTCSMDVTGGPDTAVQITLQLWEHDVTSADDHFDTHPSPGVDDPVITFKPAEFALSMNVGGWESPRCATGPIRLRGFDGDDRAEIAFEVSASAVGAPNGDSDGDGLLDAQEVCGIDQNTDGVVDIDLRKLGARPERKDAFVEIDWMLDNSGIPATQHSHEPWLPALITAWNEFNAAPVTNPSSSGSPSKSGIALHLDVGTLYSGYSLDDDGNGTVDRQVPGTGDLDLDGDGTPDIGNLGALGAPGGGNVLAEDAVMGTTGTAGLFGLGSDFQAIKATNYNVLRSQVFRYVVFGHQHAQQLGSSGLAESCGAPECDDFMVTLGGWPRQTIDANRDGVPDVGAALLRSPSSLPVDGTINAHAGTFLHELGHDMALGHGGGDGINFKPNYLSIMNYLWQINGLSFDFDGDVLADRLSVDFDGDGVQDVRRYAYSTPALAALVEPTLSEPAGIGDGNALTIYACPPPPALNRVARGTGAIDWNCNGNATQTVSANINGDTGLTGLVGFDDYARIAAGGLEFQRGISLEEQRKLDSTTQRIKAMPRLEQPGFLCQAFKTVDFEDLRAGTSVINQYAPLVTFDKDAMRKPAIADPAARGGAATHSGRNSLLNRVTEPVPLVARFGQPQRAVSLFFGRNPQPMQTQDHPIRAVLQAFDANGLSMGEITTPLSTDTEVTHPLTAVAIFPDQLMSRIELRFEAGIPLAASIQWVTLPEPQQIDDLSVCSALKPSSVAPTTPQQPQFGDLPATLNLTAVVRRPGASSGEPGHVGLVETPLTGLQVKVDGMAQAVPAALTKPEGTHLSFTAPATFAGARFQNWRLDDSVSFGTGRRTIPLALLRSGKLTAVYYDPGREHAVQRAPRECQRSRRTHRCD